MTQKYYTYKCKSQNGLVRLFYAACLVMSVFTMPMAHAQISAFEDPAMGNSSTNTEFVPRKDEFDGGEIGQSQTAQVVTLFRNATSTPITISRIQLVPSSNVAAVIGSDQCSAEPVKPGVECAVTVSLTGQGTGKFRVGMLVSHSGKTRLTNAAIIGTVGAGTGTKNGLQSEIESFPDDLNFGTVTTSAPLVRSLALRNSTGALIKVTNIQLAASPSSGFQVSAPKCKELKPSQACVATVTWTPTTQGVVEGVIVLRHDGPSGAMRVGLKAEYNPKKMEIAGRFASAVPGEGLLISDQDKIDFGEEVDGAASITVSLVNQGDKELTLNTVKLAGSDNGLSLSTTDCRRGTVLSVGEACVLTVNWQPRRIGPVIDDVQILHTGSRGVLVLPVRGTAEQPVSSASGPSIAYPELPDMPKLSGGKLDERVLKAAGVESSVVRTAPLPAERSAALNADNVTPSLDGYRISSVSNDHAIVAGPKGRLIIKNDVPQVIAGVRWTPHIVEEGVELSSGRKVVLLLFDRSLTVMQSMGATSGVQGAFGDTNMSTISNVNTLSGAAVTATPTAVGANGTGTNTQTSNVPGRY
ncbi:MAG TPA: choice-of-anchor D domain-containing protein [Alphaproteobacteria bacterium]